MKPWRRTDPKRTVGRFVQGDLRLLRSSNAIAKLRRENPSAAEAVELLREKVGRECPTHGRLEDPIIAILGDEIAFACPDCSDPDVRDAWAREPLEAP